MLKYDDKCPCGSGYSVNECCIPDSAPISRRQEGFNSVDVNSELVDSLGKQFPFYGNISVTLNKPQQMDIVISNLFNDIVPHIQRTLKFDSSKELNRIGNYLKTLEDCLYAVRYHQQQFLFRLRILTGEHLLVNNKVTGNVEIIFDDRPLRYEFDSFVSTVRTTLDVLSKLVSFITLKKEKTHGEFVNYLQKNSSKNNLTGTLNSVYVENEKWIKDIKQIRDAIQHDGKYDDYNSFSVKRGLLSKPTINKLDAQHICFKTWSELVKLIKDVVFIAFQT